MCSRCRKRVAVVFIRSTQSGTDKTEGFCVKCAKELGIKPIEDLIAQTGFDDETIEKFNAEMDALIQSGDFSTDDSGRTPIINFAKLMGEGDKNEQKKDKKQAKARMKGKVSLSTSISPATPQISRSVPVKVSSTTLSDVTVSLRE